MPEGDTTLDRVAAWIPWLLVGLGLAFFVCIRLQVFDDEVPNPDISGILYNADGLLRGELPYVDNAELKPLGSYFPTAACFWAFGRNLGALQWFFSAWILLGVPAVAVALPGASRCARALAVGVYLYYGGMFTYNYTAWMMPVYAWAFAGIIRSLDDPRGAWAILAGIASSLAFAIMQRGGVLGPLALALWGLHARRHGPNWRTLGGWVLGASIGAALVAGPYLARAELNTLLRGLFPIGLVTSYSSSASGGLVGLAQVPGLLADTFGGALVLASVGLVLSGRERNTGALPAALFVLASLVGTGLGGGRFYVHYMPQVLPALAVLVGATTLGRTIDDRGAQTRWRAGAVVAVVVVLLGWAYAVSSGDAHRYEARARRLRGGRSAAQVAGAHIRARTGPEDSIYGWGWTAWRVYFWADRRAPGRYYKALGRVTTFNTNTAFDPGENIEFAPGPHADAFIADFDAHPPAYVVLSPSFTSAFGAEHDPLQDFTALRERLERDYRPEAEFGDLLLLRRQGR